jgi:hypothetical protein
VDWIIYIFIALAFILVIYIIATYTRRVTDLALTDQFRAAEAIANGRIPENWVKQIDRELRRRRTWRIFLHKVSGTDLALSKIDRLYRFFQKGSFFETAEARELLLARFQEMRQRWERMAWEEIAVQYGAQARPETGDK